LKDAVWVRNNVMSSAGSIGNETSTTQESTLSLSNANIGREEIWPDINVYYNSWRQFRPAIGYETRGGGLLYAELEAKRIALGL
jgi:hypothetical protein